MKIEKSPLELVRFWNRTASLEADPRRVVRGGAMRWFGRIPRPGEMDPPAVNYLPAKRGTR